MRQSAPSAARSPKRPFWFDPRFAIGLVLVVGSIVGVSAVVASVDDSVQVYAARATLPAGTPVTAADLDLISVRLGTHEKRYLAMAEMPKEGLVLTRAINAGELIPSSAVNDHAAMGLTSVVVALSSEIAGAVVPGASVDLWGAEQLEQGRFGPPVVVVASAEVVRAVEDSGFIGSASGGVRSIELQLPTNKVAAVLQAIANRDALSLVPASAKVAPTQKAGATPTSTASSAPEPSDAPQLGQKGSD